MPSPSEHPYWLESLVSEFSADWKAGRSPILDQVLPADPERRQRALVPLIRIDLQHRLEAKQPARVEDYLQRFPEIASRPDVLLSLLETESRVKNSLDPYATSPSVDDQVKRFPMLADRLRPPVDPHQTRPPDRPVKLVSVPSTEAKSRLPGKVGRYRVEKVLGQGGFGLVYLAHDDQLLRPVAIKLPHPERIRGPEDVEEYLTEAQTVTSLKHPHIVTVLDVGGTAEHPFFVVSEYIAGSTLDQRIRTNRPSLSETIDLVSTIAQTLHFAHKKGIVHRDIKPGNILLDEAGKPYVADFGLALREQDVGKRKGIAGTPSYMSPEQARGEAHRVDGRSDLFSLGIVFYQMITGHLPFQGDSVADLLDLVINAEFKPPRQWDENIPREIERICTKALAKRASDRYSSCNDFAEDLAEYLKETSAGEESVLETTRPATPPPAGPPPSTPIASPSTQPGSDSQPILRIVPKGLRSFDAHDADFFLDLLPGPRDRHGLPDSIRFWKQRIEEMDADKTFSVGLIYGPSGCGKSSLVKAGLLPRLAKCIQPVYLEATAEETEARLWKGLRKECPLLPAELDLIEGLKALQRGKYLPANQKVLIVIDQFEQWLHAHKEETNPALVQALRHCDGRHVQCIVMVRDDFWMAATRFMKSLEIRLLEGNNSAAVDLFDRDHALKVLKAYGLAYGKLSDSGNEQKNFLTQAIAGLAEEGKVISVRLALFAEMMKGKPWTPAALKAVGGTAGVGVTFLEETFSANSAPPEHRYHQKAAQAVLQALLPESGSDIKGHMRSREDLLSVSGYGQRRQDFADLLQILDSEIRLITPTDPEGTDSENPASGGRQPPDSNSLKNQRYYQLTHDYLVPSLRDWLTRKEKETPKGRARLLLADRAAVWSARPEARQLPSLLQWLQIRRLTDAKAWTPTQQKMMRTATRHHTSRILLVTGLALLLGFLGYETYGRLEARQLCNRVLEAPTPEVAGIVKQMSGYRRWVDPLLRQAYNRAEQDGDASKQFKAAIALLPDDPGLVPYLHDRLLLAKPDEVVVLRQALVPHQADLIEPLWQILENRQKDQNERLRASCALAEFTPQDPRWKQVLPDVAAALVSQKPFEIVEWRDALKTFGPDLLPSLADFLSDQKRSFADRALIAEIYVTYAAKTTDGFERLERLLSEPIPPDATEDGKRDYYKKQASIGLALLVMNRPKGWAQLEHSPNPSVRGYLIEWLAPGGVDYRQLVDHFRKEENVSIRRAILLSLGQYGPDRLPLVERKNLTPQLLTWYQADPDPGMHGALGWLLRTWGEADSLQAIDQKLATGKREGNRQWLINSQNQTLAAIPKSTPGLMIATLDVTIGQYQRFCQETKREYQFNQQVAPSKDCPAIFVSWYDAAAYCNWLSEKEKIPKDQWCYEANKEGEYGPGMVIKKGYLKLRGYRLPTELEWETACRAGAGLEVGYGFGDPVGLLASYGWYSVNSESKTHPVGKLKPNDWGLFDVNGNVWQWTQTLHKEEMDQQDGDPGEIVQGASLRVMRGGSWNGVADSCRAAFRSRGTPDDRGSTDGFRLAQVSVQQK